MSVSFAPDILCWLKLCPRMLEGKPPVVEPHCWRGDYEANVFSETTRSPDGSSSTLAPHVLNPYSPGAKGPNLQIWGFNKNILVDLGIFGKFPALPFGHRAVVHPTSLV